MHIVMKGNYSTMLLNYALIGNKGECNYQQCCFEGVVFNEVKVSLFKAMDGALEGNIPQLSQRKTR